jgi:hypothetical protein
LYLLWSDYNELLRSLGVADASVGRCEIGRACHMVKPCFDLSRAAALQPVASRFQAGASRCQHTFKGRVDG